MSLKSNVQMCVHMFAVASEVWLDLYISLYSYKGNGPHNLTQWLWTCSLIVMLPYEDYPVIYSLFLYTCLALESLKAPAP